MLRAALNFLAAIAILSIVGLVACGVAPGDQSHVENTLANVLTGAAFAIAALVSPARPGSH